MQGILMNADSMEKDSVSETMVLQGHVQIVYQGQHLTADYAKASLRSRQIDLIGHVEIITAKTTAGGEEIKLDYETNTGLIYNGYVQSGSVSFQGRLLQKTGEDEYYVLDADYTACTNCPSTWSFTGGTIRAELGGYAYIRNSWMRVGGVPIFWFPYLIIPLKSERQSGLLTPGFENSNTGGFAFSQPYFWAISRNTDATLTLKNYSLRGLKELGEYRYVPNENSLGTLSVAAINDRVFKNEDRVNAFRTPQEKNQDFTRWFTRYDHYYELPDGVVQRAHLNFASDLEYAKDFPLETMNFGDSAMENRVSVTKNTQSQHYSFEGDYYVNMLHSNPLAPNDDAVHRLPELHFAQTPQNIGRSDWLYSMDLDYVDFTRSGPGYDNLNSPTTVSGTTIRTTPYTCAHSTNPADPNDPNYDRRGDCQRQYRSYDPSRDLIRTGQRFDFQPSIYRSFKPIEGVDITPKFSYRETHYEFNVGEDPTNVRRYVRTELDNRMTFSSVYGDVQDPTASRYKHEIVPEITYSVIPWLDHKSHPFFGFNQQTESPFTSRDSISDGDLGSPYGLQFDYNDRIADRNLVTFALTNKLVEKRWVNNRPEYRQIASFRLAQSYDAYQDAEGGANKEAWSDISATIDVRLDHFQTYSTFNYFPSQKVTNTSSRVRLLNDYGQFLQLGLTKTYPIVPGQDPDTIHRTEDYTFSSGFISRYLNLMGRIVYDGNYANSDSHKTLKSWAYIAQFKPPGDCWLITFIQDQITGGDTTFKMSFEFTFDGIPKVPLPPEALDAFGF